MTRIGRRRKNCAPPDSRRTDSWNKYSTIILNQVNTDPADAKGCLKGAAVGGVAGHYAGHHGVLGAIAGCAYGRHRANEQDRQRGTGRTAAPAGEKL